MNARYFDVDNFVITAKDIRGPWSEPVYLHSAGFDASMFHDEDGRKYVVSLEWETREGYEKPGAICMAEYSPEKKAIVGYPKRISVRIVCFTDIMRILIFLSTRQMSLKQISL